MMEDLPNFQGQKQRIIELFHLAFAQTNGANPTLSQSKRPGTIAATYDYQDEVGNILFQCVRYEPKGFSQRRPDGSGGWIEDLKGTRLVLYHLPEISQAHTVVVLEGEKDVDTACRLGLPDGWAATTSPMGAEKWNPAYSEILKGKEVVICPDQDGPGQRHGRKVAAALNGITREIRWLNPPQGKDLSEWVTATQATREDFITLLNGAVSVQQLPASTSDAVRRLELIRADKVTMQRTDWTWEGRIPQKAVSAVVGDPDNGKTMLCLDLAAKGTAGKLDGIYRGVPFDVVIASVEDSTSHTLVPRLRAAGADLSKVHFIQMRMGDENGGGLSLPDDLPLLAEEIKRVDAKLLLIDPLMSHFGEGLNANKDQDIRKALAPLAAMAEQDEITIIVICHLNKNESASSKYRIGGSVGIFAVPRSVLLAGEHPENEGEFVLVHLKCNVGGKAETLRYSLEQRSLTENNGTTIETGVVVWGGSVEGVTAERVLNNRHDSHEKSAVQEASEWLEGYLGDLAVNVKDIHTEAKKNGFSEATLRRAKDDLNVESGRNGFGKEGAWTWRLPKALKGAHERAKDAQCPIDEHLKQTQQKITNISNNLLKGAQVSGIEHLSKGVEHLNDGAKAERPVPLDF
ncbi:MAG: AAA family ATPase [Nitrospirales bacterium]|nr:AAA family ATPase [Nitrospirales bacterium]